MLIFTLTMPVVKDGINFDQLLFIAGKVIKGSHSRKNLSYGVSVVGVAGEENK